MLTRRAGASRMNSARSPLFPPSTNGELLSFWRAGLQTFVQGILGRDHLYAGPGSLGQGRVEFRVQKGWHP